MSGNLAIAAVTKTIQAMLELIFEPQVGNDVDVTTRPPDKISTAEKKVGVNLFLYQITLNDHWRNGDLPWQVKPGETAPPVLPLNLYYLLTTYYGDSEAGVEGDDLNGSHQLLGVAMQALHDHAAVNPTEINKRIPHGGQPFDQVENVRIRPLPLSLDELSKLWSMFQMPYRPSVAYEVSVVFIDSNRVRKAPLPVLRRGPEDKGVETVLGPFSIIEEIRRLHDARFGDTTLEILGRNLGGESLRIRFSHPRLAKDDSRDLPPEPGSTLNKVIVKLPMLSSEANKRKWAAGYYMVTAVAERRGELVRISNASPFALPPTAIVMQPTPAALDENGAMSIELHCEPYLQPDQEARLILGDWVGIQHQIKQVTEKITFTLNKPPAGEYLVRLRVDGVDSLPVVNSKSDNDKTFLAFDEGQKVTIAPRILKIEPNPAQRDINGTVLLKVSCNEMLPKQIAKLRLRENGQPWLEVRSEPVSEPTDELTFKISNAPVGRDLPVRLRITDVDYDPNNPNSFVDSLPDDQRITVI